MLNRIGFGGDEWSRDRIATLGLQGYVDEQLDPATIDETDNTELHDRLVGIEPPQTVANMMAVDIVRATYARRQLEQMRMLTGSLAHDLRTPLCTAMNAVGNLRDANRQPNPDPDRIERAYAAAEKSLQRCHHLITAVVD